MNFVRVPTPKITFLCMKNTYIQGSSVQCAVPVLVDNSRWRTSATHCCPKIGVSGHLDNHAGEPWSVAVVVARNRSPQVWVDYGLERHHGQCQLGTENLERVHARLSGVGDAL